MKMVMKVIMSSVIVFFASTAQNQKTLPAIGTCAVTHRTGVPKTQRRKLRPKTREVEGFGSKYWLMYICQTLSILVAWTSGGKSGYMNYFQNNSGYQWIEVKNFACRTYLHRNWWLNPKTAPCCSNQHQTPSSRKWKGEHGRNTYMEGTP